MVLVEGRVVQSISYGVQVGVADLVSLLQGALVVLRRYEKEKGAGAPGATNGPGGDGSAISPVPPDCAAVGATAAVGGGWLVPGSEEELGRMLRESGIDLSLWGVAGSKSVRHLMGEIEAGECSLRQLSEDRTELPRSTGTARVNGGGTAMAAPSRLSGTEFDCGSDAERRGVDDGLVSEW